jgi:hypothetical protein
MLKEKCRDAILASPDWQSGGFQSNIHPPFSESYNKDKTTPAV